MDISPKIAAQLADDIYLVQNEFELKSFLLNPIFSSSPYQKRSYKATVGGHFINTKNGFGVCARGGAGYEKDLFLMFRGTTTSNYGVDFLSNARLGVQSSSGGLVHVGFSEIFKSMRLDIDSFISSQMQDRENPIQTIHCIGHSLGGAVATLTADHVQRTTNKNVVLYTFGAPKPGFEGFAKSLTTGLKPENVHRVYHATDPIPMVPLYPFMHPPLPGYGHFVGSTNSILSFGAHKMGKYIKSVENGTWKSMQKHPPIAGYEVIEKWLESDGGLNPFGVDTWCWMNAGLEYVLKKILGSAAVVVQAPFIGALSLADKIAWILHKGIDLAVDAGKWVLLLMRKMMQMLHMKVVDTANELTRALMRAVLERIMDKINQEAIKALYGLLRPPIG